MPEVTITVQMKVRVGADPLQLERACHAEARRVGRELYAAVCAEVERDLLSSAGARQRTEPRWVATTMGRVRIERWRVKPRGERTVIPLDAAMGWAPRTEASVGLREAVCDTCLRVPFREAAVVLSRITGEHHAHQSLWKIVQDEGGSVRTEQGALVEAIFDFGELPDEILPRAAHELVVVEADGTFLRAQREDADRFEVKTAITYAGKQPAGGRRHRRFKLLEKGCFATTADADTFGTHIAVQGMVRYGLHLVPNVLCAHDGLDEYGQTFHAWLPGAVHQVDHFHVAERLWQAVGGDRRAFTRLRTAAFADPVATARKIRRGVYRVRDDARGELAGYLEGVAADLWGILRIPRHLRRGRMFIVGSGVVEKHQDTLVGRRMKRRGMRWTRRGADNLLALQGLRFSQRWPQRWGVMPA